MKNSFNKLPDLSLTHGVVAPEILNAAELASEKLREAEIPHALAGGLAICAYGYPRTTDDVDFLVGDEAFIKHLGGIVTLKLPLIAVGNTRVDFVSTTEVEDENEQLRLAVDNPHIDGTIPIVPLTALVYMKLKAGRQRDISDLVELMKRGKIDAGLIDQYLDEHASDLIQKWVRIKEIAAKEE